VLTEADSLKDLRRIAPDISPSVARLPMPAYILDRDGVVRWLNMAAVRHFGDIRGRRIAQIVEPEYATLARQEFAAKLLGTQQATEGTVAVRTAEGRRVLVDISSTQLVEQGSIVGVFGLADPTDEPPRSETSSVELTPRQLDVLRYVAAGHSTEHIAKTLGISTETVRNHVRGLMARLDAHTRLEAVIRASELGLV
jgi:DNA-binding CsgD family transcriptional regulator